MDEARQRLAKLQLVRAQQAVDPSDPTVRFYRREAELAEARRRAEARTAYEAEVRGESLVEPLATSVERAATLRAIDAEIASLARSPDAQRALQGLRAKIAGGEHR